MAAVLSLQVLDQVLDHVLGQGLDQVLEWMSRGVFTVTLIKKAGSVKQHRAGPPPRGFSNNPAAQIAWTEMFVLP